MLTFHVDSQRNNNNSREETFQNLELKKINRRKHHREKVQELVETRDEETQERGRAREERGQERGQEREREDSAQRNGKNEDETWKFDRREFHFTDLIFSILPRQFEGPTSNTIVNTTQFPLYWCHDMSVNGIQFSELGKN